MLLQEAETRKTEMKENFTLMGIGYRCLIFVGGGIRSNCLSTVFKDNMVMEYEDFVQREET